MASNTIMNQKIGQTEIEDTKKVQDIPYKQFKQLKQQAENPCTFYLKQKLRFCQFQCLEDSKFCKIHSTIDQMVVCPVDNTHKVNQNNLKEHVRKCSKKQINVTKKECYSKNINFTSLVDPQQQKLINSNKNELLDQKQTHFNLNKISDQDCPRGYLQKLQNEKSQVLENILLLIPKAFQIAVKIYFEEINTNNQNDRKYDQNGQIQQQKQQQQQQIGESLMLQQQLYSEQELERYFLDIQIIETQKNEQSDIQYQQSQNLTEKLENDKENDKDEVKQNNIEKNDNKLDKNEQNNKELIETLSEKQNTTDTQRHNIQGDKLIQILDDSKLLNKQFCYIEFGAGKGLLSSRIADYFKSKLNFEQSCNILIEREGRKRKFDRFHRENKVWTRLLLDIVDFDINSVPELVNSKGFDQYYEDSLNIVGISKHMCGMGTDLSIRTLFNIQDQQFFDQNKCQLNQQQQEDQKEEKKQRLPFFKGLMIATCCHQHCKSYNYTNIDFLKELGFQSENFDIFFHISSWYVSNNDKEEHKYRSQLLYPGIYDTVNQFQKLNEMKLKEDTQQQQDKKQHTHFLDSLELEHKIILGKMTKKIIDIGRVLNLRKKLKSNATLIKYCEQEESPENFIIIMN